MAHFSGFDYPTSVYLRGEYRLGEWNDNIITSLKGHPCTMNSSTSFLTTAKHALLEGTKKGVNSDVLQFESLVDRYDPTFSIKGGKSIADAVKSYYNPEGPMIEKYAYEMFEILSKYQIVDYHKPVVTMDLASGTGSWTVAVAMFRDKKYGDVCKKDVHYTLEHKPGPSYGNSIKHYFQTNKTKNWDRLSASDYNGGDLTSVSLINDLTVFAREHPIDLIIADAEMDTKDLQLKEQEHFLLLYGEILTALLLSHKGSNFVIKMFSLTTKPTLKLLSILKAFYNEVCIYKPFSSGIDNVKRCVICKGFRYDHNWMKKKSKLYDIVSKPFHKLGKNRKEFCWDLFPEHKLTKEDADEIHDQNLLIEENRIEAICLKDYCLQSQFKDSKLKKKLLEDQKKGVEEWIKTFLN